MTRSMYSKERNPPETEMINRNAIMKDGSLPVVMILDNRLDSDIKKHVCFYTIYKLEVFSFRI